jgi:transcriptional regulator with XRE-family HTH domain
MRFKTLLKALGQEVRERRLQLEMTQGELAHLAETHLNIVGRLERGEGNPTLLTLLAIATVLNLTVAELLSAAVKRVQGSN